MHDVSLTPIGDPPSRHARWCPACQLWLEHTRSRRCVCGAAVVRQPYRARVRPQAGELRPGIVGEFEDPRDAA
jgi:hypothetical protein